MSLASTVPGLAVLGKSQALVRELAIMPVLVT